MGKYDEYIINPPVSKLSMVEDSRVIFNGFFLRPDQFQYDFLMGHQIITKDMIGDNPAHYHNHHEVLMWIGATPGEPFDFGAEVHLFMGAELEEHVFTRPTVVILPPGLVHAPLSVIEVVRPVIQIEMMFATEDGSMRARIPFFKEEANYYQEHPINLEVCIIEQKEIVEEEIST